MSSSGRSSLLREHYTHPSFSSSLLEEIYRSFDDERDNGGNHNNNSRKYIKKSVSTNTRSCSTYLDRDNRVILDRWIVDDRINRVRRPIHYSSSTSSSDSASSFNGGFSSSDTESLYGSKRPTLEPIRTVTNSSESRRKSSFSDEFPKSNKKKKLEGNNLQNRALKLYGDLKKVKQPISPGGKLASFLNSIFNNGGGSKKPKMNGCDLERENLERERGITTARSCLSKTPSSTGRFERRSVRFVDEEVRSHVTRSRGDADVPMRDSPLVNDEEFKVQIREKQRRVEEMAKELLKNYHKNKVNIVSDNGRKIIKNKVDNTRKFEDVDEDEDDLSCCSSDLFELDHLLDLDRYREELPVYETTHVDTNRAIANGYIL